MIVRGPKSGFRRTITLRRKLQHDATPAERIFWGRIAKRQFYGLKFRKQHGIADYIVDFYYPEKKAIIEIDGDSHATDAGIESDEQRTAYLQSLGYTVIRYHNRDIINNIDGVLQDLTEKLNQL